MQVCQHQFNLQHKEVAGSDFATAPFDYFCHFLVRFAFVRLNFDQLDSVPRSICNVKWYIVMPVNGCSGELL